MKKNMSWTFCLKSTLFLFFGPGGGGVGPIENSYAEICISYHINFNQT